MSWSTPTSGELIAGRRVRIDLPGVELLTLAEEVRSTGRNVAVDGTATQSSEAWEAWRDAPSTVMRVQPCERILSHTNEGRVTCGGRSTSVRGADDEIVLHNRQEDPYWSIDGYAITIMTNDRGQAAKRPTGDEGTDASCANDDPSDGFESRHCGHRRAVLHPSSRSATSSIDGRDDPDGGPG